MRFSFGAESMTKPLVLFDLLDTLIDRAGALERWVRAFAAERTLDPDAAVSWFIDGDSDGEVAPEAVFDLMRLRFDLDEPVDEMVADLQVGLPARCRLGDDTTAALRSLRRADFAITVVSNGDALERAIIQQSGVAELVDGWVVAADVGAAKPDRAIFEAAATAAAASLEDAWLIGDHPDHDIGGAHDAGLPSIWLNRGRTWDRARFHPSSTASSAAEAVAMILSYAY